MQLVSPTLPAAEDAPDRAVLRDGTVVQLRLAVPDDRAMLRRFFTDLSVESKRRRFFTGGEPSDRLVEGFCDSSDLGKAATLVGLRLAGNELHAIAVGTYIRTSDATAEVAFAVDDRMHGKGLATVLLERLATMAFAHGISRFEADTQRDNAQMLDVFRESGFEIHSTSEYGVITVRFSLDPTARAVAAEERRDSIANAASLRPLFAPAAVAVVGASRDATSVGRRVLRAIVASGFTGAVYPVNPHTEQIDDLRCYTSIEALPPGIDLAVITLPAPLVSSVVDELAAAGVRSIVVISAGFAETGEEGRALQRQLVEKVRGHGMRMVGPNCMGLLNTAAAVRLNATFSSVVPPPGRIALLSQSGALGLAILELAKERGVGLSTFVSVGNKADVSGNDLLQYWEADAGTSVMLLYLESFGNPKKFARLARRIARRKPIVALKAGRSKAGSRAAGSHTAALAARDVAVDALFRQCGVIRADTIDEMFDIATCLDAQPLPAGHRVAVVTNAGGPGILAVDACEAAGLQVQPFSEDTRARLAQFLPAEASTGNPVDMVASAGPAEYQRAVEVALAAPEVDALIIIYTPVDPTATDATLQAIRDGIATARSSGRSKPILACLMANAQRPQALAVGEERIPAFMFPENAARALGKMCGYAEWRARTPGLLWSFADVHPADARATCQAAARRGGDGWLRPEETQHVLASFGLPVAAGTMTRSPDEAAAIASVIGLPVAAKLVARTVQHKTDVGGVRLNLGTPAQVRRAVAEILAAAKAIAPPEAIDGVLIQSMITGGVETMIGISQDRQFGPLVAFGLGGIQVEVLGDVQFRIAPLTDQDANDLLHGIRALPLLTGFRGRPPADLDALRDVVLRVSRMAVEVPEIAELDLNPVMALPGGQGCRIVDARIRVAVS